MAKREIKAGVADQTIDVFIQDSSVTTGAGLTGLVWNTAGLTCYYRKGATGTPTSLSLAVQTVGGAHSDGGFVAVDGTNCPGQYRLDLSDTIVATAGIATLYLRGATNMVPCVVELEVVSVDKYDSVRMGLTGLANATPGASGGLLIAGTNAPVTITGSGAALTLTSTGGNESGLKCAGSGLGHGIAATGGATAGAGMQLVGGGGGYGLIANGGATGDGAYFVGGGTTNHGLKLARGGASGDDLNFVNADCTIPLVTTTTTVTNQVTANVTAISGDSTAADNAEAFFDGTGYGNLILRSTVASVQSQTTLTLNTTILGQSVVGCTIVIRDAVTGECIVGVVTGVAAGEDVTFTVNGTAGYTIAGGDYVSILLPAITVDQVWDELQSGHTTAGTFGKYLDAQVSGAGGSVDATNVDRAHTWVFANSTQLTAAKTLQEYIGFTGILAMDFANAIPSNSAIGSVTTASFANITGTEPTVGTLSISTDLKKAYVAVNATSATANTYTLSVTVITTDSQTFTRKGRFTVS